MGSQMDAHIGQNGGANGGAKWGSKMGGCAYRPNQVDKAIKVSI